MATPGLTAGHLVHVHLRRIRFDKGLAGQREVRLIRCNGHVPRRRTLPADQARELKQTIRTQLTNRALDGFLDRRRTITAFST